MGRSQPDWGPGTGGTQETRTRTEYRVVFEHRLGGLRYWNRTGDPALIPGMIADCREHRGMVRRAGVQRAEVTEVLDPVEWKDPAS
jgi:hypothetical protein